MAERSHKSSVEFAIDVFYYKWEFLRRNGAYRKSYRELWQKWGEQLRRVDYPNYLYQHEVGEVPNELVPPGHRKLWDDYGDDEYECDPNYPGLPFMEESQPKPLSKQEFRRRLNRLRRIREYLHTMVSEYCDEWGVTFMKNPFSKNSRSMMGRAWKSGNRISGAGRLKAADPYLLNPFWLKTNPASVIGPGEIYNRICPLIDRPDPQKLLEGSNWLYLGLNLNVDKKVVLDRVGQYWDDEQAQRKMRERALREAGQEHLARLDRIRLNHYDGYLKVWDLRVQQHRSKTFVARRYHKLARLRPPEVLKKEAAWSKRVSEFKAQGNTDRQARSTADEMFGLKDGHFEFDARTPLAWVEYAQAKAQYLIDNGWRELSPPPWVWI